MVHSAEPAKGRRLEPIAIGSRSLLALRCLYRQPRDQRRLLILFCQVIDIGPESQDALIPGVVGAQPGSDIKFGNRFIQPEQQSEAVTKFCMCLGVTRV